MNLPVILDIIIGLFFIYLILSLLASEIQELIATLLQWRAKHLKQSIESLLAGGGENANAELIQIRTLANQLYDDPLISTLNQEARGIIASSFRQVVNLFGSLFFRIYCLISGQNKEEISIFGKRKSGPSYIQAETFATTLFKTLEIPTLIQKANAVTLEKFLQERIENIEYLYEELVVPDPIISDEIKASLQRELTELRTSFESIIEDLKTDKSNLEDSIIKIAGALESYSESLKTLLAEEDLFLVKVQSLQRKTTSEKQILIRSLQRSVTEVLADYKEIKEVIEDPTSPSGQRIQEIYGDIEAIKEKLKNIITEDQPGKLRVIVPNSLLESLSILAKRTQIKIEDIEKQLNHFKEEVETWFDRSMDRAAGVYKRNAKGLGILIGLLIALILNADTFHIVDRFSKDSALRAAIAQNADTAVQRCLNQTSEQGTSDQGKETAKCLQEQVEPKLTSLSLPLGWDEANLNQQKTEAEQSYIFNWFPLLKRILGWVLTGLAIAMGAPFWFDLLGKAVNVRNTGPKPTSSTQDQPPSS